MTTMTETLADPAADAAPLVVRLVAEHGARWVPLDALERFLAEPGDRVLFFHGDPVRFPECVDVAVVLPELQRSFFGRFAVGVVPRADDEAIGRRFGAMRRPSLVFLRDGRYVTTVAGMLDWSDFIQRVAEALAMPATRAPTIGIPLVASGSASSCSG